MVTCVWQLHLKTGPAFDLSALSYAALCSLRDVTNFDICLVGKEFLFDQEKERPVKTVAYIQVLYVTRDMTSSAQTMKCASFSRIAEYIRN
jgi:hypothetical protein